MAYKNNLEDEFKSSQTYKILQEAQQKISSANVGSVIGENINKVQRSVNSAVNTAFEEVKRSTGYRGEPSAYQSAGVARAAQATAPEPDSPKQQYRQPEPKPVKTKVKKNEPPECMMMVRKKSPAPFYAAGITAALYASVFPLYRIIDFVMLAAVCSFGGWLFSKIFKGKKEYVKIEVPEEKEEVKVQSRTGDPEVDKILEDGYNYIAQLEVSNDAIEDENVSSEIDRMVEVSRKIFEYIDENPSKAGQIRRFMNYYLPTTLKLLNSYFKLTRQGVEGKNISDTIFNIEGMLHTITGAFEKQLDALFQDEALDVSTDITVMENMLKQEDLL